jgi:hypothetical protein
MSKKASSRKQAPQLLRPEAIDTTTLSQAHAVARLIMMADELPHEMAGDMNAAFWLLETILEQAVSRYQECDDLENAYAIASLVVQADYDDDMRDDIARAAGVVSKLIDTAIAELEKRKAVSATETALVGQHIPENTH